MQVVTKIQAHDSHCYRQLLLRLYAFIGLSDVRSKRLTNFPVGL